MKKKISINELAMKLGLSKSTVSKALNDRRDVGEATKKRVREMARKFSYRPDPLARAMTSRKSGYIGLILYEMTHDFFAGISRGVIQGMTRAGYRVVVDTSGQDPERERRTIDDLLSRCIDGLIIEPCFADRTPSFFNDIGRECPTVIIDNYLPGLKVPFVGTDFEAGSEMAAVHLLNIGHRRIGMMLGPPDIPATAERIRGYSRAFETLSLRRPAAKLVKTANPDNLDRNLKELMKGPDRATAIICANAEISSATYLQLQVMGFKVPGDVSLLDFGSSTFLSSLDQNTKRQGELAVEALLALMEGRRVPGVQLVEPVLVERGTTISHVS